MFTEDLVFLDQDLKTSTEVLNYSFEQLRHLGYVETGYLDSILKREGQFPTGLMTHVGINIAMPHTEAEFAKKEGIVFIRTKNAITFNHMVNPDEEVATRLIFNIVVKNPKNQVIFLTKLMKMFQSESLLSYLLKATDKTEIVKKLQSFIEED